MTFSRLLLSTVIALAPVLGAPGLAAAQEFASSRGAEAQLEEARRLFDGLNYAAAASAFDDVVLTLEPQAAKDSTAARLLATAYEWRGRTRLSMNDTEAARSDFRALLRIAPGYALTGQPSSRVRTLFDELVKSTVGKAILNLTPIDADLELDGKPFTPSAGAFPMAAGRHTFAAKRFGFQSRALPFSVIPGETTEVEMALERIAATVALVSVPADVHVLIDGISRGRTAAGPPSGKWDELVAKLNVPQGSVSSEFVIDDIRLGTHVIELQRDCYAGWTTTVAVETMTDLRLEPVKLEKSVASIVVESEPTGATVFLDGESRGPAPLVLEDVCEGHHTVDVRSPWGRAFERLTAKPGDRLTVQAKLEPAVAILSATGLPEGYRGADPRLPLERALAATTTINVFAPATDKVEQALKADAIAPGWLAFDRWRRPIGAAAAIAAPARLELARRVARSLEVQGVAELTLRPGGDRSPYLLTVLSSEGADPDVLELDLENPSSVQAVTARLNTIPALYRPSVGLSVADVNDIAGAVVVTADGTAAARRSGLTPGDVITSIAGQPVADGSAFNAVVARAKANQVLAIEVKDTAGAARAAELTVSMAPRLVAMHDQSLLFNTLALTWRARLATSGTAPDPVLRLNLAVVLMRLGNHAAAKTELAKVQLAAGPGVSGATVQYLLGLCAEVLGQPAEAEAAWRAAAASPDALLTEDGPPVKELAEAKLKK